MPNVLFVTTELKNAASQRRHRRLIDAGADVTILQTFIDKSQAGYGRRIPHFAAVITRIGAQRNADVIWAWGLDACLASAIALRFDNRKLIWDISDLLAFQLSKTSKFGWAMRQFERLLLPRVDRLVLSSPGFIDAYYGTRISRERISIIENLLESDALTDRDAFDRGRAARTPGPLKVVYAGIFRSNQFLEMLADPAANPRGEFEFHLHGIPSRDVDPRLIDRFVGANGCFYHGPYVDPDDLSSIYMGADVVFSLLDTDVDDNEKCLLPNRFYHAGLFGVPLLATQDTYLGSQVIAEKMGVCVKNSARELAKALTLLLDPSVRKQMRAKMPPASRFAFNNEHADILNLVRRQRG